MRSLVWVTLAGCAHHAPVATESVHFDCKDRIVSYMATHHMGGDELGVQMDCKEAGPRIKRWRSDKTGARQEDARSLTPAEFDKVWREIDGTGWPNLHDCTNGTAGKRDPIYVFDIKDDQNKASFQCQSQTMPYPYNDIVDPLDMAAQAGKGQLNDDEPADLKKQDPHK
jgi:hypothetical protein